MRVLVDTHTILWAGLAPAHLGKRATAILANRSSEVYVSAASAWEIATKVRLGKLPGAEALERDFADSVQEAGYTLLSITAAHALRAGRMPGNHRDPFDRILAAQALAEDIPILSIDTKLDSFGITRIW
jgi:PIN domain nuclease of toxin-antitoxin system